MLQAYVSSVLGVSNVCLFYLDVAYVCYGSIHMFQACFKCFKCFRLMLQVFHLNVAKVDLDVAYVAMTIHACFKCFICFRCMLQVFHLDISKVDLGEHMFHLP